MKIGLLLTLLLTTLITSSGIANEANKTKFVTDQAKLYKTYCQSCHGAKGDGNSAEGSALSVKPRDFTDRIWQHIADDQRINTAISRGGVALGLSNQMAAFGGILNEPQISLLVAKVRSFKPKGCSCTCAEQKH